MIRILTFLLVLIGISHYLTTLFVYLPLTLLDWLESALHWVLLVIITALILWFLGD